MILLVIHHGWSKQQATSSKHYKFDLIEARQDETKCSPCSTCTQTFIKCSVRAIAKHRQRLHCEKNWGDDKNFLFVKISDYSFGTSKPSRTIIIIRVQCISNVFNHKKALLQFEVCAFLRAQFDYAATKKHYLLSVMFKTFGVSALAFSSFISKMLWRENYIPNKEHTDDYTTARANKIVSHEKLVRNSGRTNGDKMKVLWYILMMLLVAEIVKFCLSFHWMNWRY